MRVTLGFAMLVLCSGSAWAQTPAKSAAPAMDKAAIEKSLIATDQKVFDARVKGDTATMKALIAPDAMALDESMGLMPVSEILKMIKPGDAKITESKLDSFKTIWVNDSTAILTFTWTGKGTMMNMPVKSPVFCATTYVNRGGKWMPVFHQETPKAAMPAAPAPAKKK